MSKMAHDAPPMLALRGTVTLLVIIIMVFSFIDVEGNSRSQKKILEARRKINKLKSLAIKSIQSEDGDIIDCIDIYKQPAFDHPALKNHKIQMKPSFDPNKKTNTGNEKSSLNVAKQIWQRNGSCPKGTIPIRRPHEKELLKTNAIEEYGRKKPSFFNEAQQSNTRQNYLLPNRAVAILITAGYSYNGVKGDIRVFWPQVEDDDYSLARVSVKSGPYYEFECLQAGWAVNPGLYGDRQTRLYVYWTVDASNRTGCFDLTCPGFVQTSSEIALGAAFEPFFNISLPEVLTIYIVKDVETGNWWVRYEDNIDLGYWPQNLFTLLFGNAQYAEWGGEVYSTKLGTSPHTTTQMGSGRYPIRSIISGSVLNMRIRDNSMILKFPEWASKYADEYNCYNVLYIFEEVLDPQLFYGGPGRSWHCP